MRLAIDPGADTGWAVLNADRKLMACGLGDARRIIATFRPSDVVIERPIVHKHTPDPDSIIKLAIGVGRYAQVAEDACARVEFIQPHTWKGSLKPDICLLRIVESLPEDERALLFDCIRPLAPRTPLDGSKKSLEAGTRHNVIDAVGLAKWSTKRARAGVF